MDRYIVVSPHTEGDCAKVIKEVGSQDTSLISTTRKKPRCLWPTRVLLCS